MGIDTHTDTSCARKNVRILEYMPGAKSNVSPFQGPAISIFSLANSIVAVDREEIQIGYILELNSFLDFSKVMEYSLLCLI